MVYALWARTIEGEFKTKEAKNFEEARQQKLRGFWLTSHYFYCIVANSFDTTFTALNRAFGNIYSSRFGKTLQCGIILGEQWYFRVTSDVAVMILLKELSSAETEIEVISCAGGAGYLAVSYSAHSSYVHKVRNFLIDSGFKIKNEREIPYYSDYVRKSREKTL